jgi:hypothetical protein
MTTHDESGGEGNEDSVTTHTLYAHSHWQNAAELRDFCKPGRLGR